MKKLFLVLLILILICVPVYADYTIEYITKPNIENYDFIETSDTNINEKAITKALNKVDYQFKNDYTIFITNSYIKNRKISGIASPDNTITLLKFIPKYTIDEKINLDEYYQGVVTHELGHLVYYSISDEQRLRYFDIRNLPKDWGDSIYTSYRKRPSEIFAEDFRILFGNEIANKKPHMNRLLKDPKKVKGLKEFIKEAGENK